MKKDMKNSFKIRLKRILAGAVLAGLLFSMINAYGEPGIRPCTEIADEDDERNQ